METGVIDCGRKHWKHWWQTYTIRRNCQLNTFGGLVLVVFVDYEENTPMNGKPSYEELEQRVKELEDATCNLEQIEKQLLKLSHAVEQSTLFLSWYSLYWGRCKQGGGANGGSP